MGALKWCRHLCCCMHLFRAVDILRQHPSVGQPHRTVEGQRPPPNRPLQKLELHPLSRRADGRAVRSSCRGILDSSSLELQMHLQRKYTHHIVRYDKHAPCSDEPTHSSEKMETWNWKPRSRARRWAFACRRSSASRSSVILDAAQLFLLTRARCGKR